VGGINRSQRWERVSKERLGNVLSKSNQEHRTSDASVAVAGASSPAVIRVEGDVNPDAEAEAFVRFCYRRRSVAWPELYDEMCAVAARGDYRGMDYDQLRAMGVGFALSALPRMAELAARVIADERGPQPVVAVA
jgi:hypothetical protein